MLLLLKNNITYYYTVLNMSNSKKKKKSAGIFNTFFNSKFMYGLAINYWPRASGVSLVKKKKNSTFEEYANKTISYRVIKLAFE